MVYTQLNVVTIKNKYHMRVVKEILDDLTGSQWFTKLDIIKLWWQKGEEHKTSFKTHNGHFELKVVPFGLKSAPTTLQEALNTTIHHLIRNCVLVFVDDILMYTGNLEEHKE